MTIGETAIFALFWSPLPMGLSVFSLWHEPRIWLHHVPSEVKAAIPPKTPREKALTRRYALIGLPLIAAGPLIVGARLGWAGASLITVVLHSACVFLIFNAVDLVLDLLVLTVWRPRWSAIPDHGGRFPHGDSRHHMAGFLRGFAVIGPLFVLLGSTAAFLAAGLSRHA